MTEVQLCEWFDDKVKAIQKLIPYPESYKKVNIIKTYKNIVTDLHFNKLKINRFNIEQHPIDINKTLERSYKYEIRFNSNQKVKLKKYFEECVKVYNLCVDIWTDYKNMTDCWELLKDIIYDHLYRFNNGSKTYDEIKISIINELKKKANDFKLEQEKYREEINKQKAMINENHKKELELHKKLVKEAKNNTIKTKIPKPKKCKINIVKKEKVRRNRRENIKKPAPDETLKGVIKEFCSNLKANRTKVNEKTIDNFEMKYLNIKNKQTILVSNRNMSIDGLFIQELGKTNCYNYRKIYKKYVTDKSKIGFEKECKLKYDKILNKYYLYISQEISPKKIEHEREQIVGVDPGEKTFLSFYSGNKYGKIGDNMRIKILKLHKQIKYFTSILDKGINKEGKKLKNKNHLRKKIYKLSQKINGYVNEVHKKAAKYLCENYENILLPEFETKSMLSKKKRLEAYDRIRLIKDKSEAKKELRALTKKVSLSKNVKYVLSRQSHYKFKQYIKAKAEEYEVKIYDVDEKFTSQSCTKCGALSKVYENREKECIQCKYKINRDTGGSLNIVLKSLKELIKSD
jgi:putative transposase